MISWVIGQMAAGRSPAEIVCRLPILPGWPPAAAEPESDSACSSTPEKMWVRLWFRLGAQEPLACHVSLSENGE